MTYFGVIFKRATMTSLDVMRKHYVANLLVAIAGVFVLYFFMATKFDEVTRYTIIVLTPLVLVAIGMFVYNLVTTPARIYHEQKAQIGLLEQQLNAGLAIELDENNPALFYETPFVHEIEELFNSEREKEADTYSRLCRLAIRNLSQVNSTDDVTVKLTEIHPCPENLNGKLPLPLHFMHDNTQPYKIATNLNPGITEYVDVVSWHWKTSRPEPVFYIYTSVAGIDTQFPMGDYQIKIEVAGRNVVGDARNFCLGIRDRGGKGSKLWLWNPEDL